MVNSKTHGMRGAIAIIVALLMMAFGVLCSMPASAEEGGIRQNQVSQVGTVSHSEAKEDEQEEGLPEGQDEGSVKGDGEDEHADSLDGDKEKANAPPASLGEVVARFIQSISNGSLFGGSLRAESEDAIEFYGHIQWDDFDNLYGDRPESASLYVSIVTPEGNNSGYGGGIPVSASTNWEFTYSIPKDLVRDDEVYIRLVLNPYEETSTKINTEGETVHHAVLKTFHPHIQVRWDRTNTLPPNPNLAIPFTITNSNWPDFLTYSGSIYGRDCVVTEYSASQTYWDTAIGELDWPTHIDGRAVTGYSITGGEGVGYDKGLDFIESPAYSWPGPNFGFYAIAQRIITVDVVWEDNGNANGHRPGYGYFHIFANGEQVGREISTGPSFDWNFYDYYPTNDANGDPIDYTVGSLFINRGDQQISPPGYTQETTGNMVDGFVITLREEAPSTVDIPVQKVWNDQDDLYENRPDSVTYHLYASVLNDEGNSETEPTLVDTKVATAADDYAVTFEGMPEKDDAGNALTYHVGEEPIVGYKTNEGYRYYESLNEYVPRNVFDGTNPVVMNNMEQTYQIYVQKLWDDEGHEDDRPASATFNLVVDGETVDTVELTADNSYEVIPEYSGRLWVKAFSIDYPSAYQGVEIEYSVTEVPVDNYTTSITEGDFGVSAGASGYKNFAVTNTYNAPTTETVNIPVKKIWQDSDDAAGLRPETVTFLVFNRDVAFYVWEGRMTERGIDILNLRDSLVGEYEFSGSGNVWEYTIEGLPKTDANGDVIPYTVCEKEVVSYTISGKENLLWDGENPVVITNRVAMESSQVTKVWDDGDDALGIRPDSITIHVMKDGEEVLTKTLSKDDAIITPAGEGKIPNEDGTGFVDNTKGEMWTWEAISQDDGIPMCDQDGNRIQYEIVEDPVEGYELTANQRMIKPVNYFLTNSIAGHASNTKRTIKAEKVWDDGGYEDERPESVIVWLYADGDAVDSAVLSEENEWTHTFEGVDEDAEGEPVNYEVFEDYVEGYETSIERHTEAEGDFPPYVFTVTNTRVVEEPTPTKTVKVNKVWDDDENAEGKRPNHITVRLYADGKPVNTAELSEDNKWSFEFGGLPVADEDGKKVVYSVVEDEVAGYSAGFNSEESDDGLVLNYELTNTFIKKPAVETPKEESSSDPIIRKITELVPTGAEMAVPFMMTGVTVAAAIGAYIAWRKTK